MHVLHVPACTSTTWRPGCILAPKHSRPALPAFVAPSPPPRHHTRQMKLHEGAPSASSSGRTASTTFTTPMPAGAGHKAAAAGADTGGSTGGPALAILDMLEGTLWNRSGGGLYEHSTACALHAHASKRVCALVRVQEQHTKLAAIAMDARAHKPLPMECGASQKAHDQRVPACEGLPASH